MPRRSILTESDRVRLFSIPDTVEDLIYYYTLTESDLSMIGQRRGDANRLGFSVQLCYLRFPGFALPPEAVPPEKMLAFISHQLNIDPELWPQYAKRIETRREHLLELQSWLSFRPFSLTDFQNLVCQLSELAEQTDRGVVLVEAFIEILRQQKIIIPPFEVIDRVCSEALTRGTRRVYEILIHSLSEKNKNDIDSLLMQREGTKGSGIVWFLQPPGPPRPKHILSHLGRLEAISDLKLPEGIEMSIHQNRLLKIAREGSQMTSQHLRDLEPVRRYATIVAVILDTRATLIDEIIDMHDRFMRTMFSKAKRKHADRFQQSGKSINEKVRMYYRIGRALLEAKQNGCDPFQAIESIIPWETFAKSVDDAEKLAQPEEFDHLSLVGENYNQIRRYIPVFLDALKMKSAASAHDVLKGVELLKEMNARQARKVPNDAPTTFVRKRWENLVYTDEGLDRRFYELCVLSELKNSLRSGDIWVQGSRQFKNFEDYLLPKSRFVRQRDQNELALSVETNCDQYLEQRLAILHREMKSVERLALINELPNATITSSGRLKIYPLESAVPDEAELLIQQAYNLLPHIKITELLLEVDSWTGFSNQFKHLKNGVGVKDRQLLLTAILADAINLGLRKMSEVCPGTTYAKLTWLQAWHIRDETYISGLADIVNAQIHHPFAVHWGDGTTSSSDGQNFKAGGRGQHSGQVNLRYGQEPSVQFYTHISDQYAPFHTKVINSTVRDATFVLDGLLYHESDLRIEEHYTDTAGFTDHLFALMHLLGFRFAPRIRDLADTRLYINDNPKQFPTISGLIGGNISVRNIKENWDELLRLASSIKQGTVTASLMLRKLGSYPRQNGLAIALRELGRIERTIFILDWLQNVELRRSVQIGLNKGEAKNALARAVFLNRLGEFRDRGFENQMYRASGLNLVVAAIILWNTVYLEKAVCYLEASGKNFDPALLQHLSPLGWEHINLTGDYVWEKGRTIEKGQFRPLRMTSES